VSKSFYKKIDLRGELKKRGGRSPNSRNQVIAGKEQPTSGSYWCPHAVACPQQTRMAPSQQKKKEKKREVGRLFFEITFLFLVFFSFFWGPLGG
jgi:hypothetical protein